ncbi:hypothetical protein FVER53590_01539 [Fusarium verticillioides]|nr:hypothetical protein FVER53590_01539 [Fusarium verticillioides]
MNDTERDYDHNGDANTELFDADAQLGATSVSICLNIFAGDNTEFHTRNDPAAPFQPSTIIEWQGITEAQCFSREIKKPLLVTSVGSELTEASLGMLRRLLELKLDVNCKDLEGDTPLTTLIRSGTNKPANEYIHRDKALKMLIDHGVHVNLANDEMRTPLQYAVIVNYGNAVQMLLEAGADPNLTFKDNRAPLCSALHYPKFLL